MVIQSITAEIAGNEIVVSGSGTDRTTHTHPLHRQKLVLLDSPSVRRGELLELQPQLEFPDTVAWSVDLPDNQIVWTVTLAIRLKMWPDWVSVRTIRLLPRPAAAVNENPNPAFETISLHELVEIASYLEKCGSDTARIDEKVLAHADKLFTVSVDVDEVLEAGDGFDDPEYASGRTVSGRLTGTEYYIGVRLPARYNAEVDRLGRGHVWTGSGAIIRWDPLLERLIILGL